MALTGWKTLIFSAGVALLGVAQATNWVDVLGNPQTAGFVVTAIGVMGAVLRLFTTTKVGGNPPSSA